MNRKRLAGRVPVFFAGALLALAGCGKAGKPASMTTTSSSAGSGGAVGSGGGGGAGGSAGGAGGNVGGAGGSGGMPDKAVDFEGIDTSKVPMGTAPLGCVGGFDVSAKKLTLTLSADVPVVLIAVVGGVLQVNGVPCSDSLGMTHATTANTRAIDVNGTDADEAVIVDLSSGPFGALLAAAPDGGIHVDLGGGNDAFSLRGSYGADHVKAGTESGAPAFDLDGDGHADTFVANTESLTVSLGPGNDSFHGSGIAEGAALALAVTVYGGAGNDTLQGGDGDDALHGGAGDDTFVTAAVADGADTYDGGDGHDTVDYSARTGPLSISIDGHANDGAAGENDDVTSSIEVLIGGSGDDVLVAGLGAVTIYGGAGNDTITGGPGNDELHGEDGNDVIHGGDGDDTIYGDAGDDMLYGDAGDDLLDSGPGNDYLDGGAGDGDICDAKPTDQVRNCEL